MRTLDYYLLVPIDSYIWNMVTPEYRLRNNVTNKVYLLVTNYKVAKLAKQHNY